MGIKRLAAKVLKGIGAFILLALVSFVLYLIVVTTDTPERQNTLETTRASQKSALPGGASQLSLSSLGQASEYFGGKMLVLADNSGFRLESIELRDWQPDGAPEPVREVRLGYSGGMGTLWVSSVSPASYLNSLPQRGYTPVLEQGITLAGLQAVLLMSATDAFHIYAQSENVVFELEGALSKEALCELAWQAKLMGG
ncbi:MAG TPA: hypothetical protein PKE04_21470 [Clostridia bacterium]|nr:hypothetical protein [Clostridia bacterium]